MGHQIGGRAKRSKIGPWNWGILHVFQWDWHLGWWDHEYVVLFYVVLWRVVLYCGVLCCVFCLFCVVLCCFVLYCDLLCCFLCYVVVLCWVVLWCVVSCCVVICCVTSRPLDSNESTCTLFPIFLPYLTLDLIKHFPASKKSISYRLIFLWEIYGK